MSSKKSKNKKYKNKDKVKKKDRGMFGRYKGSTRTENINPEIDKNENKKDVSIIDVENKVYIKENEEFKVLEEKLEKLEEKLNDSVDKKFDTVTDCIQYNISKAIKDNAKDLTNNRCDEKSIRDISDIKNIVSNIEKNKSKISDRDKKEIGEITSECVSNKIESIKKLEHNTLHKITNIESELHSIKKDYKKINSQIEYINDIANQIEKMNESLEIVTKTVELLQGKMNYLDSINDLKESIEKISKKSNKEENVASNLEEEIIINLGQYGEKIVKELTNTARCYAQNKDSIESIQNERSEYERKILKSKRDGIEIGKLETIKEIINKNDGIDELFDSEDPFKKVISDMLRNNGFSRDEELKINKEITITEENIENVARKASNIAIGKYKVIKSAIMLNGDVYKDAVLNRIDNN